MKPFFVYMLRCRDGSYYVGHTDDLEKRVAEHQHGAIPGHTSTRRPVELVWCAELESRDEALQREMQVKGWTRRKKEALVREDWARLKQLARGPDRHARAPFDSAPGVESPEIMSPCATLRANGTDERGAEPALSVAAEGRGAEGLRANGTDERGAEPALSVAAEGRVAEGLRANGTRRHG